MAEIRASGGGGPLPGSSAATMQRQVDQLQLDINQLRRFQSSGRWWLFWTTLLVCALIVAFTFCTYWRIRQNFNPGAVREAVNNNGTEVLPLATQMLMQTGRDAMPAYQAAMVAALRQRGPAMAQSAYQRVQQVQQQDGQLMEAKLQTAFDGAMKQIEPDLKKAFPNLSDEKRQAMIADFAKKQIDAQNKVIADRATQLYTNDMIQLQAVLDKFQLPDEASPAASDERGLERQFLHTMVMLLDEQVDAAYDQPTADEGADTAAPLGNAAGRMNRATTRPAHAATQPGQQAMAR